MNKQEFEELIRPVLITDVAWDIIETVYNFHPAIPNIDGKTVIAKLYCDFGFDFIKAMLPQARMVEELEDEMVALNKSLAMAEAEMDFRMRERRKQYETEVDTLRRAYEQDCISMAITATFDGIQANLDRCEAKKRWLEAREEKTPC